MMRGSKPDHAMTRRITGPKWLLGTVDDSERLGRKSFLPKRALWHSLTLSGFHLQRNDRVERKFFTSDHIEDCTGVYFMKDF